MRVGCRALRILALAAGFLTACAPGASAQGAGGRAGTELLVRSGEEWVAVHTPGPSEGELWVAAMPEVESAVGWASAAPGVERGEITVRRRGEPWRVRVVLARVDPSLVAFRLVVPPRRDDGFAGRWDVEMAPGDALVAVNAGHFTGGPWGWLVQNGRLRQPAGSGRLAPGVAIEGSGRVRIVPRDSLALLTGVAEGFQSYPALLEGDGAVPPELRDPGLGVDLTHRDGRLALGLDRKGRVLFALTRVEGLGGLLELAPFGPTTPEMAALMGALGCARAVLLDGGLSGQMRLREGVVVHTWPGLRQVAAGLVAFARPAPEPPR